MVGEAEARLAAALMAADAATADGWPTDKAIARAILAADPQLAADIALGAAIRDENNPLLARAVSEVFGGNPAAAHEVGWVRAALLAKADPE